MSDERDGSGAFVVGLALGAVIGLAAGLLLAPQSGAESRRVLRERAEDLKEPLQDVLHEAREGLAKTMEEGRKALADLQARREGARG